MLVLLVRGSFEVTIEIDSESMIYLRSFMKIGGDI
jgi:hypothetical protein